MEKSQDINSEKIYWEKVFNLRANITESVFYRSSTYERREPLN